jgi:hypothetical protein
MCESNICSHYSTLGGMCMQANIDMEVIQTEILPSGVRIMIEGKVYVGLGKEEE